jgi:predicted transcriptional regulator
MNNPIILTRNQIAVMMKLSESDSGLRGRDFADISTVTSGRWEWANAILKSLADKGYVRKSERMLQGVKLWEITDLGRNTLPDVAFKDPVVSDGELSPNMQRILKDVARCHPYPHELTMSRSTCDGLASRGLVSIKDVGRGWRELRLTEKGLTISNNIFRMSLEKVTNPEDYSYDR